ncbi:MAG TPA: hypothetical protein VFD92_09460 [Candidatus Binatia bacterium]|nr:hypothetical protein [Candidatus Binatia bacterium]
MRTKSIGRAKRVVVTLPFGARRSAWDCRPFGFGRIIAPRLDTELKLAADTVLDLARGEVRRVSSPGATIAA